MISQKELEEIIKKRSDALDYAIAHFDELNGACGQISN